jgi:hypothetical protein
MLGKPSRRTRHRLEDHGKKAVATVLEVGKRGMAITTGSGQLVSDTEVAMKLNLRVEPEGEPPFEIWTRMRFSQFGVPSAGSKIAVIYDPEDHESIMRDDSPAAAIQAQMGNLPAGMSDIATQVTTASLSGASPADIRSMLAQQVGQAYSVTAMPSFGTPAPAPAAHEDPLDRLEKLADLKAKGILTEEEFQAQKAKILGEA